MKTLLCKLTKSSQDFTAKPSGTFVEGTLSIFHKLDLAGMHPNIHKAEKEDTGI